MPRKSILTKHLTVEDGLSNNWVKAILKDKEGFMWFGTFNGLNRYDGRTFKIFQTSNSQTLTDNVIESLAEDRDGNIWVGTFSGGLHRFDRNTEVFTKYVVSGNRINTIMVDQENRVWIGTEGGLDMYELASKSFQHFSHDPKTPSSLTHGLVSAIYQDHTGKIWIGTEGGLNLFQTETKTFLRFQHQMEIRKVLLRIMSNLSMRTSMVIYGWVHGEAVLKNSIHS